MGNVVDAQARDVVDVQARDVVDGQERGGPARRQPTTAAPARPRLARPRSRLEQMAPSHKAIGDAAVQAAIREAEALLVEVQALSI